MSPQRARQRAEAMGMPLVDADDIQQAWDTTGGQPVDQVPASPS
jgi:hypothetical protein